ncbi:MAG: cache domain-containing protein [Spirochaetota bacterium]
MSSLPHFNARQRPWYSNAVAAGKAVWNPPYVLFTGQELAIAASQPVFDASGRLIGVAAIDVFLSHLGDMLAQLRVGKTGQSFIMESSGFLIASSTGENPSRAKTGGSGYERTRADGSSNQLTRLAAAAARGKLGPQSSLATNAQALSFDFSEKGSHYFSQVGPFRDQAGPFRSWLRSAVNWRRRRDLASPFPCRSSLEAWTSAPAASGRSSPTFWTMPSSSRNRARSSSGWALSRTPTPEGSSSFR